MQKYVQIWYTHKCAHQHLLCIGSHITPPTIICTCAGQASEQDPTTVPTGIWWHVSHRFCSMRATCTHATQYAFNSSSELSVAGVSIRLLLHDPLTAFLPYESTLPHRPGQPAGTANVARQPAAIPPSSGTDPGTVGDSVKAPSIPRTTARATRVSKMFRRLQQQRTTSAQQVSATRASTSQAPHLPSNRSNTTDHHKMLTQWGFQIRVRIGAFVHSSVATNSSQLASIAQQPAVVIHGFRSRGLSSLGAGVHSHSADSDIPDGDQPIQPSRRPSSISRFVRGAGAGLLRVAHGLSFGRNRTPDLLPEPESSVGGNTSHPLLPSAGMQLSVSISLNAFVPLLTPASTAAVMRMGERISTYTKFSAFWGRRPPTSVHEGPVVWWQHAYSSVLRDCR